MSFTRYTDCIYSKWSQETKNRAISVVASSSLEVPGLFGATQRGPRTAVICLTIVMQQGPEARVSCPTCQPAAGDGALEKAVTLGVVK